MANEGISYFQMFLAFVFLICCREQFKTNQILVALRTDKSGKQETDEHFIPHGRLFKYISSPHFLTEILMYFCLAGIMPKSLSWMYLLCFVVLNQVTNAHIVHCWYNNEFKNYPKDRSALVPYLF